MIGEGDDILRGGNGNDVVVVGLGKDTLVGGAGIDAFGITSKKEGIDRFTRHKLVDVFRDFSVEDNIAISREGFGDELDEGVLKPSQFVIGSSAADKDDRFIYNPRTGSLFFDSDGSGRRKKVEIAQLPSGLPMTHADILITDSF